MRLLILLLAVATTAAQSQAHFQVSHSTESLRGVSAVSRKIAWASGTRGTYLRTTNEGQDWVPSKVPGAGSLDFRGVVAFSADEAFLMASGQGEQSRIYHTTDAGQHWTLQFTNHNPKGFFDSIAFWDEKHGVVLGDPVPDENGKLKFEILLTDDGQTWHELSPSLLPDAIEGEGAFAASNTCIAILKRGLQKQHSDRGSQAQRPKSSAPAALDSNIWFATGGKAARVFHSPDDGKTWEVFESPIVHGIESAGIFSITFRDPLHGVIAGGDYKRAHDDGPNLAFTEDGGKTWRLSEAKPQAYFSAAAYARGTDRDRLIVVAQDFILELRRSANPQRIGGKAAQGFSFNTVSPYPEGGALVVGAKGVIASLP